MKQAYKAIDVLDENNKLVTDAEIIIKANVQGEAELAGLGTGNPVTEEVYTDNTTVTFNGHATAVIRSGYKEGIIRLTVEANGLNAVESEMKSEKKEE